MTEPIQLLKERLNEINACCIESKKNGCLDDELESIKKRYLNAIFMLQYFGFNIPNHHISHVSTKSYNQKLTTTEVEDIRSNCVLGLHKNKKFGTSYFAEKYKVSKTAIRNIVNEKTHKQSA